MRILHVTPYWADAWAYGGIPRVAGALVRHLADAGHHVTVCTTDAHSATGRLTQPAATSTDRIDLRVFPNRSNRLAYDWQFFTPVGLHHYLRDHAHEFDVAHLHACRNLPGAVAAHHLERYGVPYVLAPNGTAPVIERRRLAKHIFDRLIGRRMLRNAAAVLAVSDAERRQLRALGVPDARIHSVPNPIELAEFTPAVERGRFRRSAGLGSEKLVTFLGKITPRKRLDVLIRAIARLPQDVRLVLAGSDMGGLEFVRALARECGVDARVHVTGLIEGRARLELLADADVVVYPGEHEVFGLVPFEALLCGTPVIVSGDSGCGEIVSRVGGGLVTRRGDAAGVAAAATEILNAPAVWRQAAARAAERVREEFGARRVADRLAVLYEQLKGTRRGVEAPAAGVSFVVPVRNGLRHLPRTIAAIEAQADGRPMEIITVDDRSEDASPQWLAERAHEDRLRALVGTGRGVSAALNIGVTQARYPVICQIDQDVELLPGWMARVLAALEQDPTLGAVQGQFIVDPHAALLGRVMALDLEQRYVAVKDGHTDHVCTGNTAYRADALRAAGGFDESLGYGNDVDLSHRLRAAGWRLGHCAQARSFHRWRERLAGYFRQQYGFGYGRLDVVSGDARRVAGDSVAPLRMMAHPVAMAAALLCLGVAAVLSLSGTAGAAYARTVLTAIGVTSIAALAVERTIAGVRAACRFGDSAALLFPIVHLLRDLAWVAAMAVWAARRALGRTPRPSDSMQPRPVARTQPVPAQGFIPRPTRTIGIIPVHNEAATIGRVLEDIRRCHPALDLLVVDDGSTDRSVEVVMRAGVRWLQLPERMGVGSAMRGGLRYAQRLGYDCAVRLDGDGQHRAEDIDRLLAPVSAGKADVALGSRFLSPALGRPGFVRSVQRGLAACLSVLTNAEVTDPTSGFCAYGPRAMRLLADHHPTGYPEPEMRLLLSRHALAVVEVPIEARARLGGRTSLTLLRMTLFGARVLLAMLIVPLRRGESGRDGS